MAASSLASDIVSGPAGPLRRSVWVHGLVLLVGAALWWLSDAHPADLPGWAPYEYSWVSYLGIALPTAWYGLGLVATPRNEWPSVPRIVAFGLAVMLIYAMLLSQFVYLAQHMFFLNRVQHVALHHIGPFLLALSWPGETIARGMPGWAGRICRSRPVHLVLAVTRQPVVAAVLFSGLVALWLQPDIHFKAMLSPILYPIMSWSMVLDGLLFWFLVLDPRPAEEAGCSYALRLALTIVVEFPQILIGSSIAFSGTVIYQYYDFCGRLFPSVPAMLDQHLGGLVVWIPQGMMGALAFLLTMNNMRKHEDRTGGSGSGDIIVGGVVVSSNGWTGR